MIFEPEIDFICETGDASVTFLENNTYISDVPWANKGSKPSIEVKFTTPESKGLLFFAGDKNDRYFALEVFDRILYMVTNVGNGVVRKQVR